ncbi:MAG: DegV family EDD domain-containing protein, partial [Lachnospiraceae bacterium]|nr:DegV family EDD domain-containing protein [Lachnospiraceae bacterium]
NFDILQRNNRRMCLCTGMLYDPKARLERAAIRQELERTKMDSSIYIMVDTLKYLKKGGRITPAAAALGTLLRIKPVLQIQGEKLDAFSKARTVKQAKTIMLSAVARDLETRFQDPEAEHTWLSVVHSCNREAAEEFAAELRQAYPRAPEIDIATLSLSVACHIGPGSLAVTCTKQLDIKAE